jgi:hypothetical protein
MKTLDGPQVGACGETVASRNHYGQHHRKRGHPKKRRTADRLWSDAAMRAVAEAYDNLTDEQWRAWAIAGAKEPSRKVLGKAGHLDARAFFSKINLPRAHVGQPLLTDPPAQADFGSNPVEAFTISHDRRGIVLQLVLARAPADEIVVYASPHCNRGKRRNWDCRLLGLLSSPVKGMNDITVLYIKKYGVPPEGKRVFIRTQQQINGWRGKPWEASAVVPPKEDASGSRKGRQARGADQRV